MITTLQNGTLIRLNEIIAISSLHLDTDMHGSNGFLRKDPINAYVILSTAKGDVKVIIHEEPDIMKFENDMKEFGQKTKDLSSKDLAKMSKSEMAILRDSVPFYKISREEYELIVKNWKEQ
jgi:hypothetical protein